MGTTSPFALIQEIREWFDGPVALSGSISTGQEYCLLWLVEQIMLI